MSEYTPTTDQVRAVFVAAPGHHTHAGSRHEAFERWLASITTQTQADDEREAHALLSRADQWVRPAFPTEASEFVDALSNMLERLLCRSEVPEPNANPDIEYRDSPDSDDWVLAITAASERDIETARRENERLGWQKFRASGARA